MATQGFFSDYFYEEKTKSFYNENLSIASQRHDILARSGSSGPSSSSDRGHCVVFLGKTRHPQSASLRPGVYTNTRMGTGESNSGGTL